MKIKRGAIELEVKILTTNDPLWAKTATYAEGCSWKAGANLSKMMQNNDFSDWEKVFVAIVDNNIVGYCTLQKESCIPSLDYTPYIGFVFVGESYRGNKISEKLCKSAADYAKSCGFGNVYLISDHVNLYEKYGFIEIDKKEAPWGAEQTIFMRKTM